MDFMGRIHKQNPCFLDIFLKNVYYYSHMIDKTEKVGGVQNESEGRT